MKPILLLNFLLCIVNPLLDAVESGLRSNHYTNKHLFTADSKTYIDEDFDLFFKKFKTQSSTQLSRIVFPLKSVYISHDEETVEHTNRSDWKFSNFDTIKKLITKKSKVSNDRIDVVLAIEDTGVHVTYHFEKRKGLWWLIKTTDGST